VDPVAVGQGDGLEVHHLQKAFSPGKPHSEVGQQLRGLLQDPIKAGEVGEGGEVSLEGGISGQVALGQVLALQQEKNGQGEELGQGGLLMPLLWGELEPLGLKGLELVSKLRATPVTHPDVDGHEKGLCVKMVKGVLPVGVHSTPLFSHPRSWGQVAHEGMSTWPVNAGRTAGYLETGWGWGKPTQFLREEGVEHTSHHLCPAMVGHCDPGRCRRLF
jgi:hypothetical protein